MSNTVVAKFEGNHRKYSFLNDIEGISVGDSVVVDTVHGYQIAKVIEVDDKESKGTKWVVQKIDDSVHKARKARDKKKQELKHKMNERRKKLEEVEIYQLLAKNDTEMANLLAEFEELNS